MFFKMVSCKMLQNKLHHTHVFSKKTHGKHFSPQIHYQKWSCIHDLVIPKNPKLDVFCSFYWLLGWEPVVGGLPASVLNLGPHPLWPDSLASAYFPPFPHQLTWDVFFGISTFVSHMNSFAKQKLREAKWLAQGHIVNQQEIQDSDSVLPTFEI